ncbi:MAG: hypothetical protein ABFE16_11125 [Armatimonadia bacterium]
MQPYVIGILLIWVSTALQAAWPVWLRIGGQAPNVLVAVVACIGLVRGAYDGCLAGLVAALLLGGTCHLPYGGLFVGFMLVGAGAGTLRGSLFAERTLIAVLIATCGALVFGLVRMVFAPPLEFVPAVGGIFASALLTAILAPVVFWLTCLTRRRETIIL